MNELFTKLPDLKQNINLTKDSLLKFYKSLRLGKDALVKDKIVYTRTPITFLDKYPQFLKIHPNTFIDPDIDGALYSSNGFYQQLTVDIQNRHFTIHLYFPYKHSKTNSDRVESFFNECTTKICLWLHFITPYIKSNCSMKSKIYLLLTNFKKMLPASNETITSKNMNSAFTTSCNPETSIHIYRYEEWFKILLHESFHCFGLDFSQYDNLEVENKITDVFKVRNKNGMRVYEAYCEVWAEVLNVVFVSFLKTEDQKSFLNVFEQLLNKELSFTTFQCSKILDHINIQYKDLVDVNCKKIKYEDECNLISYHFLKLILFLNIKKFESWCKKNNTNLFKFDKKNMLNFTDFIIDYSNTTQLKISLRRMNAFYKRAKLSHIAKNTMNMSIVN